MGGFDRNKEEDSSLRMECTIPLADLQVFVAVSVSVLAAVLKTWISSCISTIYITVCVCVFVSVLYLYYYSYLYLDGVTLADLQDPGVPSSPLVEPTR